MRLLIKIESENAAFEDGPDAECARIVGLIPAMLLSGYTSGPLHDLNGNKVGTFELTL